MTLEEALERSGTANLVDDKTLQATKELIEPNEEILYALYTKMVLRDKFSTISPNGTDLSGIMVTTDENVYLSCLSTSDINPVRQMPIKELRRIAQVGDVIAKGGILAIFDDIYKWIIKVKNKEQLDGLKYAIQKAQKMQKQKEKSNNVPLVADEIAKLKKLADEGIITEEEFQKKKVQLLNI